MALVHIPITIFLLQNIGQCYLSTDVKATLNQVVKEIGVLKQKLSFLQEYCQLQPDNICGPCVCRDDDRLSKKFYCDCRNLKPKRDCLEYKQNGIKIDGVYKVHLNNLKTIQVYCDQTTDGGGWTVFQRRTDGSVNFLRDWENYKHGFGHLQNEFWLGNDNIYSVCLRGLHSKGNELRIEMINNKNIKRYAKYGSFNVGSAATKYILHVDEFSGTVTKDRLKRHNAKMFSTYDSNYDKACKACAMQFFGAWWYDAGFDTHLNGLYYPAGKMSRNRYGTNIPVFTGIHWTEPDYNTGAESLTFTEMKFRRKL